MFRNILFCSLFATLVYAQNTVRIFVDKFVSCEVNVQDIRPPTFHCQEDDNAHSNFNATHAWYTKDDRKCIASIEAIKRITVSGCFGVLGAVRTLARHGSDVYGNPLNSFEIFA